MGITKDGSDRVSAWADQSGNGNHLTQGTGVWQPLHEAAGYNGFPDVYFDGAGADWLGGTGASLCAAVNGADTPWTAVCAIKLSAASATGFLLAWEHSTNAVPRVLVYRTAAAWRHFKQDDASATQEFAASTNATTTATTRWAFIHHGTTSGDRKDNGSESSGAVNVGAATTDKFTLGAGRPGGDAPSGHETVRIAEVAIWNRELSAAELTQMDLYLQRLG